MTMDVDLDQPEPSTAEEIDKNQIIHYLTNNETICFKSQQRGENDLTTQEKRDIALEIYDKSKLNFLIRFGKYLEKDQLDYFEQFTHDCEECEEISIILKDFSEVAKKGNQINVKNRRYEALQQLIREDSYFSDIEMMKRNPLLYEQLVGQYLTEDEKEERDRKHINSESTLVKVLMEGIERENAQVKRKQQEEDEDELSDQEDKESCDSDDSEASTSQWGEFSDAPKIKRKNKKIKFISSQEQKLLKEEFTTFMYQNFLDGKDEDFDYATVDNNDKFDNNKADDHDVEDKYFDSEEPETVNEPTGQEESEDELDIYMSALNQNLAIAQLSKDIQKL